MRWATTAGLILLAVSLLQASSITVSTGPGGGVVYSTAPVVQEQASGTASFSTRTYKVREDTKTGRLVRVAARLKGSSRVLRAQVGRAEPKQTVVQGLSRPFPETVSGQRIDINALVQEVGRRYRVDPNLIHAVIRQESNYNPFAVSAKGACGLMQLLPKTAARFGVKDIFDPAENVEGGVKYLHSLLERYDGDPSLSLAAYNAGEGAVERYGGVPPYRETKEYVGRVSRLYASTSNSRSKNEPVGASASSPLRIVAWVEPSGLVRFEMELE